jgi:hypothetical protein
VDRERFPVVLLITLLLLMKYGHRGGLVAIYCWGSPWSIVGLKLILIIFRLLTFKIISDDNPHLLFIQHGCFH